MQSSQRIEEPEVECDEDGKITVVRFAFGPHYFVEVERKEGPVTLHLGATHHGISADASEVGGELERIIDALKESNPEQSF